MSKQTLNIGKCLRARRTLVLIAAASAVLGLKMIRDYKVEKEVRTRLDWLHGRLDRCDVAFEYIFGDGGPF